MLENYVNIIKMLDNYFDGIMIVDENLIIKYYRTFYEPALENVDMKAAIGKTPFDIFTNISKENSTLYNAIKNKKTTLNNTQILTFSTGKKEAIIDNTIPIIVNDKVIGAINTVRYLNNFKRDTLSNHSNILAPCENELFSISDIIGYSEEIINLKGKILKLAKTNSNILVYGDTGTGKEMVAQAIHSSSPRKNSVFISQNCAAIPTNLLESIFFGTTKGSYTDAVNRPGIFEIADGGTVFLDEINSMNINLQAKLLKIIEEQKITRIGSLEAKKVNVRIIAAINEEPEICLKEKRIRSDLFYRLASVQIKTPTLIERKKDIKYLAEYFVHYFNKKLNMNIVKIAPEVINIFNKYNWPGNVRELKNSIETAFNFCEGDIIEKENIPEYIVKATEKNISCMEKCFPEESLPLNKMLEIIEREYILSCAKNISNLSELADKLKISKQLLNHKLKKYELKGVISIS